MAEPLAREPTAPVPTPAEIDAMREAIAQARAIADDPDGVGIVAAIMAGDRTLAFGRNEVHEQNDPTRHAEMVAITAVTTSMDRTDLKGATLISTLQPCEMCLAAMRFAGINRVIYAARQESVDEKYFQFGGLTIHDFAAAADKDFVHIGGVLEDEVVDLYADGQE